MPQRATTRKTTRPKTGPRKTRSVSSGGRTKQSGPIAQRTASSGRSAPANGGSKKPTSRRRPTKSRGAAANRPAKPKRSASGASAQVDRRTVIEAWVGAGPAAGATVGFLLGKVVENQAYAIVAGIGAGVLVALAVWHGRDRLGWSVATLLLTLLGLLAIHIAEALDDPPTTREPVIDKRGQVPIGGGPNALVGDGSGVWVVTTDGQLYRVDPLGLGAKLDLGPGLFDVDVGFDSIYATREGRLIRAKADSGGQLEVLDRWRYGRGDCEVAVASYGVFFKDWGANRIFLVPPELGPRIETIHVKSPNGMTVAAGHLFATQPAGLRRGRLLEFNRHGKRVGVFDIPADPQDVLVIDDRYAFVAHYRNAKVTRVDLEAGETETFDLETTGPSGIAEGMNAVWISSELSGDVSQISTERLKSFDQIKIGERPTDAAFAGDTLYVVDEEDGVVKTFHFHLEDVEWP